MSLLELCHKDCKVSGRHVVATAAIITLLAAFGAVPTQINAQIAVRGKMIHTMAGPPVKNGVVVVTDGKVAAVGPAAKIDIPDGYRVIDAQVVTPGLIDAHSALGLSGMLNQPHDQDQLEHSAAIQPELRAIDAYNARDELIAWVRSFGVTTIHTGHAPGELISGQTLVVKTNGSTVADQLLVEARAVAATLADSAMKEGAKSPGTRGKMMSMLRAELLKAKEYAARHKRHAEAQAKAANEKPADEKPADEKPADDKKEGDEEEGGKPKTPENPPARDLKLETLARVLSGELPLLLTADRAQDIASALRLADEFDIKLWLDSAAESYLLIDEIKQASVPVIIHPTMARAMHDRENMSMETASKLVAAGIPVALQSGYEAYVPKTRVVLFEAAQAAANGLTFEQALATITTSAARLLGVDDRVGSIAVGKDGDLALYDGDPFEYATHCVGTIIDGQLVSERERE
jgi:imidazolonepropionase-like amidohydrolase